MARRQKKGKIGRNDTCPCGSCKKYKHCCLRRPDKGFGQPAFGQAVSGEVMPLGLGWDDDLDDLEATTNGVLDLIAASRWDEAEEACRTLRERWPDQIDHLERLAMVRAAQGRHAEAADLNRQAAEFARTHEGFEPASVDYYVQLAAEQERLAADAPEPSAPPTTET